MQYSLCGAFFFASEKRCLLTPATIQTETISSVNSHNNKKFNNSPCRCFPTTSNKRRTTAPITYPLLLDLKSEPMTQMLPADQDRYVVNQNGSVAPR
jgi:hypothetical protein